MPKADLDGLTIVVTRPAHQADSFCQLIDSEGGSALRFPVMEIHPPSDEAALKALLQRIDDYQIAIFISANAVDFAYQALGNGRQLPQTLQRAAVGQATAKALTRHGQPAQWVSPAPYNSEALLAMPEFQDVAGKHIIIFRGVGGREYLADTLKLRGALVDYAECYQREIPQTGAAPLISAWETGKPHLLTITSNEALQNLMEMVDSSYLPQLLGTPLVVISQRSAELARKLGFAKVVVASAASDAALMEAIKQWVQTQRVKA